MKEKELEELLDFIQSGDYEDFDWSERGQYKRIIEWVLARIKELKDSK